MAGSQFNEHAYMGDVSVKLSAFSYLSYRDTAPLLDELNEHVLKVETKRYNVGPPAAGAEIIIVVILYIAGAASSGFFQELGKDAYYRLREEFLHLYDRAKRWNGPQDSIPMTIVIGRVRFNFMGHFTREEFRECLNLAHTHLQELPESYLDEFSDQPELNLFWNAESRSWEKSPTGGLGAGDVDI